jgi:hypothetical protein
LGLGSKTLLIGKKTIAKDKVRELFSLHFLLKVLRFQD